jgi:predicted dehydrogenase
MMSEVAHFVKDVIGPRGSVSIVDAPAGEARGSADVGAHTETNCLLVHRPDGDERIDTSDEPDHDGLCRREQELFLRAIRGEVDLRDHLENAIDSLRIVLAADRAARTGETVAL